MSTRRKDIWILLYNLVARDGTDMNDVFTFVDDILCREPSLIRPSLRELNNRFQDTFVFWIVNKFIRGLGDSTAAGDGLYERNIQIQQKILHSCLVNRALLFERLVIAYIKAIEQLTNGLQLLDEEQNEAEADADEAEANCIEITTFFSDDLCLREIDANFTFEAIRVPYEQTDERVRSLLRVLYNATLIGYALFPHMFIESLLCALQAVRECDLTTKLLALRYCKGIFEVACERTAQLEHYALLTMRAILLIWSQVAFWLHAQCMRLDELDDLKELTVAIMHTLTRFGSEMQWTRRDLAHIAINILYNCVELEPKADGKFVPLNLL